MATQEDSVGIVLFAHGSRVEEANQGVRDLARQVRESGPYAFVREAFLELGEPDLGSALAEACKAQVRRVIIIPYFLTLGIHLRRDLPKLIEMHKNKLPGLEVEVGPPLEGHPEMPSIILGRVRKALAEFKGTP